MITAQMADGSTAEFPDGTDPAVIQATIKKLIASKGVVDATGPAAFDPSADMGMGDRIASGAALGTLNAPIGLGSMLGAGNPAIKALEMATGKNPVADFFGRLQSDKNAIDAPLLKHPDAAMAAGAANGVENAMLGGGMGGGWKGLMGAGTGGASAGLAAQQGVGPLGQLAAGVVGGTVPTAVQSVPAGLKALLRGTDPTEMQQTIANFEGAGTTPTLGQASGGGAAKFIESGLAKIPGGAGVMAGKAQQQAEDVGQRLKELATGLSPNAAPDVAGQAIQSSIRGPGGFVENFKTQANDLYSKVDSLVPGETPMPIPATQALLAKFTAPIKGAEATSANSLLSDPRMASIAEDLGTDLQASANGTMPYQALSQLRSRVGAKLADAGLVSDKPIAELKQLYGSLSQDIRNGMGHGTPGWKAANAAENFYRQGMDHIDQIEPILDKAGGPEAIFKAATAGTKDGAHTINQVMSALDPAAQKTVVATVLNKMGQAAPGVAVDGGNFSMQSFLTNWNNVSPAAKTSLFDRMGPGFRADMDKIASTASNLRVGNSVFRNPAGTAAGVAQTGTITGFIGSLLTGHPAVAATIGAGVGGANLGAKLMANPAFVKWAARNSTVPLNQLPGQLGYLSTLAEKQNDPDLKALVDQAQQQLQQ